MDHHIGNKAAEQQSKTEDSGNVVAHAKTQRPKVFFELLGYCLLLLIFGSSRLELSRA